METLDIVVVRCDDWEAIYFNGEEFTQNHSHNWPYFIGKYMTGKVINSCETKWVKEDYAYEVGHFPDLLADIPEDAWTH